MENFSLGLIFLQPIKDDYLFVLSSGKINEKGVYSDLDRNVKGNLKKRNGVITTAAINVAESLDLYKSFHLERLNFYLKQKIVVLN